MLKHIMADLGNHILAILRALAAQVPADCGVIFTCVWATPVTSRLPDAVSCSGMTASRGLEA